ncbi:hypothetical protein ACHZ97_14760 [Lysobacter soli]|uniref:hypothetical protein n=1 Tax=Lysobacter soli TaxID=453783 RepID=UPI0037C71BA0
MIWLLVAVLAVAIAIWFQVYMARAQLVRMERFIEHVERRLIHIERDTCTEPESVRTVHEIAPRFFESERVLNAVAFAAFRRR